MWLGNFTMRPPAGRLAGLQLDPDVDLDLDAAFGFVQEAFDGGSDLLAL